MIIDVSQHNGKINWKKSNVTDRDYVIIRLGYRGYSKGGLVKDSEFYANSIDLLGIGSGVHTGYYFVTQAINEAEAIAEADFCIEQIEQSAFVSELPIFFDSEYSTEPSRNGRADKISKDKRTKCAIAFCERIEQKGYRAGVYANKDWFNNQLDVALLLDYVLWVAQYNNQCTSNHRVDIWQYTQTGSLLGHKGNIDMNKAFIDMKHISNKNVSRETRVFPQKGTYMLMSNMVIRTQPNIASTIKTYKQLTQNAQKNATQSGVLLTGTRVDVSSFIWQDEYLWALIPSGWVCHSALIGEVIKEYLKKV